MIWISKM